jgi:hypothetical protein
MAEVTIDSNLKEEVYKRFKGESKEIFKLMYSLKESPNKGKVLTQVSGILIKELKYKSFRFYFIVDGYKIKILEQKELTNLLIKFIAMSDKKDQQETIEKIKDFLRKFGQDSLD